MKYSVLKVVFSIAVALLFLGGCKSKDIDLQNGDLVFMDADCGDFCEAIEKVTQSYGGKRFSHVGIVEVRAEGTFVIESDTDGTKETPWDVFCSQSKTAAGKPKIAIGRLKPEYQELVMPAIAFAKTRIGTSYDTVFDIENDKLYCSELVYLAFKSANGGKEVFSLAPMTFKDPVTHETFKPWTDYFNKLNQPIPEGKPGLNPGGISLSDKLAFVRVEY